AQLTRIDLHHLWMQRGDESLPRLARTSLTSSRRGMFFLTHGQNLFLSRQKEMLPEEIVFLAPGGEHYQRTQSAVGWGSMSLDVDDFAAASQYIVGRDLPSPVADQLFRPPRDLMQRLLRLHKAAGHLAATVPDILAHPEVARAIEQELVRVMLGC